MHPQDQVESPQPCLLMLPGEMRGCKGIYAAPGPEECPSLGPVAQYIVAPGEYDVVVKSGSDADVRPFRGTWPVEAGKVYEFCLYLVRP